MFRRCILPVVVGLAALLSACGSSSTDTTDAAADQPIDGVESSAATTAAPAGGGIAGAVQVAVGALQGADDAACELDHRALEGASELYLALNGSLPPNQDALVEAQILRELSPRFEITAEGAIVPAPGSPCA
ncbi:MAG: hypothetical protein E4H05_08525 [Acidimicrobiales bacterium]|nr:MAG: hypothetical protein E4H05_08525 [Acidimicrobiales bacterium]